MFKLDTPDIFFTAPIINVPVEDAAPEKPSKNREDWLLNGMKSLRLIMDNADAPEFLTPHVSIGWPKGSRGGKSSKAIGQCWDQVVSGDKERAHIFISPELTDPVEVLAVLLHEMIHASVGTQCGHRGPFRKVAINCGLEGKMTATVAGEQLTEKLKEVVELLGDYPHPGLNDVPDRKKPGSRMLKVDCMYCGCIARMTRKWIEEIGAPYCGCGAGRMEVSV